MTLSCGSLFSGIGGLDNGLARAGFRHAFFCESDPWRRTVLAHYWPGVPVYDDVRTVGAADIRLANEQHQRHQLAGEVPLVDRGQTGTSSGVVGVQDARGVASAIDLLCGGFPCQDLSVAGRRAGLEAGERSGLFFEFARIIDALRPRFILIENVPGLLSSQGGRDFGVVLGTLADIGYGVAWRIVDSRYFGVPQRRRRVFIVGTIAVGDPRAAAERAGEILAVGSSCERHPPSGREAGPDIAVASLSGLGNGGPDDNDRQAGRLVANPLEASDGHHGYSSPRGDGADNLIATPPVSLALNAKRGKRDDGESETFVVAATLSSGGHPNSNMPGRRKEDDVNLVTVYQESEYGVKGYDTAGTLREGRIPEHQMVTSLHQTQEPIHGDEFTPAIGATSIGMGVGIGAMVRRLTPTECERLQALPDSWTNPDGKAPDSRRYAGLGDAVTASVGEWIGRRIIACA